MILKMKSGGALLYRIMSANKCKRNDRIRKVSFCNYQCNNRFRQGLSLMHSWVKSCLKVGSSLIPTYHPTYYLSITKGKNNFTMERYATYHLSQVIKLSTGPPEVMKYEEYITYIVFFPKMFTLNLMRKQTNPDCGAIYKTTGLDSSKMPMS